MPKFELHHQQGVAFLSPATEILYGGAAGGGKSHLMRVVAISWCCDIPGLQVYLFRRISGDLSKNHMEGPSSFPVLLSDMVTEKLVKINGSDNSIQFCNGSKIFLNHCQYEKDKYKYQGAEIHVLLIDELTHFTDSIYRYLRGRVRMSGIDLPDDYKGKFPRVICGSNPGGVGHHWVKAAFVDQGPMEIVRQDKAEGGMLRQYIPAKIDDNPTLLEDDPDYMDRLEGLGNPALVKAMRSGDWNIVDGGMFDDVWSNSHHILKPFPIPKTWRVDRSFDWGSSRPFSVGWWAESDGSEVVLADGTTRNFPRGTLFRIREWYGCKQGKANEGLKMLAADVAKGIKEREQHISATIRPGPADNSIFDTQDGHCIADNMAAHGVRWERSDKSPGSRTNGWELMRGMFAEAKKHPMEKPGIFVFDTCRDFIRTVPTLPRDEKKTDDVDTNAEDHCFAGDTQIITDRGIQCIAGMVGTSGQILTAEGIWADYKDCRLTRKSAETVEVFFNDGNSVKCTPAHLFMTEKGWLSALMLSDETCYSVYSISTGRLQWNHLKLAIQSKSLTGLTITNAVRIFVEKASYFTGLFTKRIMETFRKVFMSTTRTKTDQITPLATLRYWTNQSIRHCTPVVGQITDFQSQPGLMPQSGMGRQKVKFGTANKASETTLLCRHNQCNVLTVASGFKSGPPTGNSSNIALTIVDQPQEGQAGLIMNKECVSFADQPSQLINIGQPRHAGGSAGALGENKKAVKVIKGISSDVYCLSVPGYGAFALANGVMVKNCGDETRYRVSMPKRTVTSHSAW